MKKRETNVDNEVLLRLPSLMLRLAAGVPESGDVEHVPFDVIDHFA